ncbi:hypothetical protein CALCODRAFT_509262 [Calocera cornea HHB12733]|uniref:Uncharacterized protein n=1 Tax=Calocera cornea HHB12733 TaxID=1353952 RepID=A0A165FG83_9BASI|nr:hypothetical protein CALCODRAFT_509262 [Calocera cornea HHB12733]
MATAPPFTSSPASVSVDSSYLARTRALQFSQLASLALPPLYTCVALYRRTPLTINRFLRASWVGTATAALLGGGWEIVRLQGMGPLAVGERAWAVGHDANRLRSQDYSLIGSFIGSLTTSAVLWKRARKVHLVLGGAVLGEAAGFAAHLYQSWAGPALGSSPEVVRAEQGAAEVAEVADVPPVGK